MKKISCVLVWALLVSMLASLSAFAASETKIETEQGGYVTLSNIVKEVELIKDNPEGSDTAYISEGPVKLTMVGDDPHPGIQYTPEAYIEDGVFMPSSNWKPIEISGNSVTFSDPGYYFGLVYFGSDFSFSSTATFVIQVVNSESSSDAASAGDNGSNSPVTSTFELGKKNSGYSISFPNVLKLQRVQGTDEEFGKIDVNALVLGNPKSENRRMNFLFKTTDPKAHHAYISVESFFGGQVAVEDMTEIKDGVIDFSSFLSETTIEEDIMMVRVEAYDKDGKLLFSSTEPNFFYEGFNRTGYSRTDVNNDKTEPVKDIVSAKSTSSKVLVNGKEVSFQAYNINSNNYFKLRDMAMVLNGTDKSFSVGWDGEKNAISLVSGNPYKVVGGELFVADKPANAEARLSTSTIYLDGKEVDLTAYTINGNNYFKLRDLAAALDFGVTWDASSNSIVIDTSSGYVPED